MAKKIPMRQCLGCRESACLKQALRSRAIERSLDTPIPQELCDALIAQMEVPDGT